MRPYPPETPPAVLCTGFEIRGNAKYFHTYIAKTLYLSKRVRFECLTHVQACDIDDLRKLERLLGYVAETPDRGIVLRVGERMSVRAYIDRGALGCTQLVGNRTVNASSHLVKRVLSS